MYIYITAHICLCIWNVPLRDGGREDAECAHILKSPRAEWWRALKNGSAAAVWLGHGGQPDRSCDSCQSPKVKLICTTGWNRWFTAQHHISKCTWWHILFSRRDQLMALLLTPHRKGYPVLSRRKKLLAASVTLSPHVSSHQLAHVKEWHKKLPPAILSQSRSNFFL